MNIELVSTVICEDVLANPGGRLTLYNLFRDLTATAFPASLPRLHVVTTWYNTRVEQVEGVQTLIRVAILAPDGETLVGDAAATISVAPGMYHTQVSRFRDLVLPEAGTYRVQVTVDSEIVSDLPLVVGAEA